MPIANCIVTSECNHSVDCLVAAWSNESGISSEHMTINTIASRQQFGNKYAIMATLSLPSGWSKVDISSLQVGLATALSKKFAVNLKLVHVVTRIIDSGMVVEDGQEMHW